MNELTKETSVYFDLQRLMYEKDDQLADYHIEIVCEILAKNLDKVKEIVNLTSVVLTKPLNYGWHR